jgi:uncharacterized protein with HEPN domain
MLPHDKVRIDHMLDACREIEGFTKGIDFDAFLNDRKLQLSLVQLIQIIGEAANGVSSLTMEQMREVPWTDIIGMRNRLVHGYHDIDLEIVWKTATSEVPELRTLIERHSLKSKTIS